jgi:hypothetical protein
VDAVVILVALAMVGVMGWLVYRKMRRDEAEFARQYQFDDEGVQAVGEKIHNKPFQFQGEGAQSTRPIKLEAGDYKIRYRFPEYALVKVELFSADDGEGELILLKSGDGEASFTIEANGRYLFDIDPQQGAAWKLEINRLGLPSGYKPPPL